MNAKAIFFIAFYSAIICCPSTAMAQLQSIDNVQLNGRVLEMNSGKTPVANVKVTSDSANSILSNTSGLFTLKFQDKYAGQPAYIWAEKQGWELVNEEDMDLYLPMQGRTKHLDIIVCKQGYLEQARKDYYKITDEYIKKEYKKRLDKIIAQKEKGWQQEVDDLQEKMKMLENQLEKQVEEYIRTNRDFLTEKEIMAIKLFEEGKIDESLQVRQSLNSEEELKNELENSRRAEENIAKAENEKTNAETAIALHRRNLKQEAELHILKFEFDKAEHILRNLAKIDSANIKSVFELGVFLQNQDKGKEAVDVFEKALKLSQNMSYRAEIQNRFGVLYLDLNDYKLALRSFQKAMQIFKYLREENAEKYDPDIATLQNNFGVLYMDLNDYESALKSYQKALEVFERLAAVNVKMYEPKLAMTHNNLGILYSDLNDYESSLRSYQEALQIRKRLAAENAQKYEPLLATTLINLGTLYSDLNDSGLALRSFQEALEIFERLTAENVEKYEPYFAMMQNNLGELYHNLNDYESALRNHQEALGIRKRLAAENAEKYEPKLAETLNNLGIIYSNLNDSGSALESYQEALEIFERMAAENVKKYEPYVAVLQNNLGVLYRDLNDYESALRSHQEALGIRKRLAAENAQKYEPKLAETLNNLGVLYRDLNDYESALRSYQEALKIWKRLAKENAQKYEPHVAMTQNSLGVLYRDLNDYESALRSYQEALEIRKRLAKENLQKYEPHVAMTQNSLGALYHDLNNYESAKRSFQRALEIYKRLAEKNAQMYELDMVQIYVNIGLLQKKSNRARPDGIEVSDMEEVIKICENYPDIPLAKTLKKLALEIKTYYEAFPMIKEINALRTGIEELEKEKKVEVQREIILRYKEVQNSGYDMSSNIGRSYGSLAWYQLFNEDFQGAESSAREALNPTTFTTSNGYDEKVRWVNTNLALALLFQGKYEAAKKVYLEFKDMPYNEHTYKEVFLEDLLALEKEGITHPDVQKIKELLNE